ncbi:patatin-like phospholipase family protein [Telmatospirillum siberiense]|uniref:PNPLA domain-containing protein n=1 Tax=Telmatospirillum siberiense TaxID=382514 RepID=A0A2N3PU18_9PROT|nr:patatin-like phospholipase family protein [Telmatospirillum siberiense]PKU23888.1 hypothetical protein CWS72_14515 [Telmatospirillum siberiense]
MKKIENLVFKGGGVLGAAYVGAFQALQEARLAGSSQGKALGNVSRVAGTSAGSIFGALVSLGFSAEKIASILAELQFSQFVPLSTLTPKGFSGAPFLDWMGEQVKEGLGSPTATFAELREKAASDDTFKDLHVFSMQVPKSGIIEFSAETTPDVPIAQAVRASMSIPFFFVPWQFSGDLAMKYPGPFIDGGVAFNYPIPTFDDLEQVANTLGLFLVDMSATQQGIILTILHLIESALGLSQTVRLIIERLYQLLIDLESQGQTVSDSQLGDLIASSRGGAVLESGQADKAAAVLRARLVGYRADGKGSAADIVKAIRDGEPALQGIIDDLEGIIELLLSYADIIGATVNPPANMVFRRDASRTIMVNSLGFSFVDMWMPDCNKTSLTQAGYNCAQQYLKLIMYT